MKILGTICARGGSKGIKNKNIRPLLGIPLIAHSILTLKSWGKADKIICSTDSKKIQEIAKRYGAEIPFTRPDYLATDDADKHGVLIHALNFCEKMENVKYDYIVDLDPTSPLRTVKDLESAFRKLIEKEGDLIFSVYKSQKNPYFNMVELNEQGHATLSKKLNKTIVARQQAPIVYSMNASIYIYKREALINHEYLFSNNKIIIHEMPDFTIDIDREIDFNFIELILKKGLFKFDY